MSPRTDTQLCATRGRACAYSKKIIIDRLWLILLRPLRWARSRLPCHRPQQQLLHVRQLWVSVHTSRRLCDQALGPFLFLIPHLWDLLSIQSFGYYRFVTLTAIIKIAENHICSKIIPGGEKIHKYPSCFTRLFQKHKWIVI